MRVGQVRVRVSTVEVRRGCASLNALLAQLEFVDEDSASVRAGDAAHAVKEDLDGVLVRSEIALDEIEVEDLLEKGNVVDDGVDDLDGDGSDGLSAKLGEVDLRIPDDTQSHLSVMDVILQ